MKKSNSIRTLKNHLGMISFTLIISLLGLKYALATGEAAKRPLAPGAGSSQGHANPISPIPTSLGSGTLTGNATLPLEIQPLGANNQPQSPAAVQQALPETPLSAILSRERVDTVFGENPPTDIGSPYLDSQMLTDITNARAKTAKNTPANHKGPGSFVDPTRSRIIGSLFPLNVNNLGIADWLNLFFTNGPRQNRVSDGAAKPIKRSPLSVEELKKH